MRTRLHLEAVVSTVHVYGRQMYERVCACLVVFVQWVNPALSASNRYTTSLASLVSHGTTEMPCRSAVAVTSFTATGTCAVEAVEGRVLLFPSTHPASQLYDLAPPLAAFVKVGRCTKNHLVQHFWNYFEVTSVHVFFVITREFCIF